MSESKDQQDEISLFDVVEFIRLKIKVILKFIVGFTIVGIFYSLDATVEFTSPSKILPRSEESTSGSAGMLSKLSGLGGIDISSFLGESGSSGISPMLYSEVVKNNTFIYDLLYSNVAYRGDSITLKQFMQEEARFSILSRTPDLLYSIPSRVFKVFGKNNSQDTVELRDKYRQKYSMEDEELIIKIKERISIETDSETGVMVILVVLPSPGVAAQINKKCLIRIEEFVEEYRLGNTKRKIEYLKTQLEDAEEKLNQELNKLSRLKDSNKALVASDNLLKLQAQEAKYDFAFNVYSGIQQQIEQAQFSLLEEKIVIDLLEPARIPNEKSAPRRTLIVIAFSFLGAFTGIMAIYFRKFATMYNERKS